MKKKTIFPEAKFYVKADKMTPLCWKHIKLNFRKKYQKMLEDIKLYGAKKVTFGLSDDLEPICVQLSLR